MPSIMKNTEHDHRVGPEDEEHTVWKALRQNAPDIRSTTESLK
jgi:hypothetical protein